MSHNRIQRRLLSVFTFRWTASARAVALATVLLVSLMHPLPAYAETTYLVNTESFDVIDDGDLSSDIELRFGATNEKMYWNVTQSRFDISDDVHITNNLTASGGLAVEENIRAKGNLTINSDNDTSNATFTFGNATLAQTLMFLNSSQKFRFSTSLDVVGTLSGSALTISGLRNCDTIDTDQNGVFGCGTDSGAGGGMTQGDADARYVNLAGDTMTGALTIQNGNTPTPTTAALLKVRGSVSGALLRANNLTVSGAVLYSSGNTLMQTAKGSSGQLLVSQETNAPKWVTPVGGMMWYFDGTQAVATSKGPQITMPFAITLSEISLKAKGAPTGSALIYDINSDGVSLFSTRPQINAGATTGGGSAVFTTTNIAPNAVLTLDIDQVGSTFAGSGVTIMLKGTRKY